MVNGNPSFLRPEQLWRDLGLRGGQTVVHLGSGPGFYLVPAAKMVGAEGKAIGIDIVPTMLEEVESRARHEGVEGIVQTMRANLEETKGSQLPPHIADWVLVANILHQANPTTILQEAARIVKADGSVVVVEWDTAASPLGPPISQRFAKPDALAVAEASGLTVRREFRPSPYHYGLILKPSNE